MNTHAITRHRFNVLPRDPARYAMVRLWSMVVVGAAILGMVGASLLDGVGTPFPLAVGAGLVPLVTAMAIATWAALSLGDHAQLGPDPEQVTGRATGART